MHPQQDEKRWTEALRDHAAQLAFPDWTPGPDDWTSLYTSHATGTPCTEVAVYRGDTRIHYRRYTGDDLRPFWMQAMSAYAET